MSKELVRLRADTNINAKIARLSESHNFTLHSPLHHFPG
jgi:hypothetical protein